MAKKQFQTKGDNNNTEDSLKIDYESIEGKYVSKIPLLGKVTLALKGKLLIIVIAFMIYFYYIHSTKANTIRNRRKMKRLEYEREKNQEEEKH